MKQLLLGAILAFGLQSQASTTSAKSFTFNGSQTEESFALVTEKNHTEYRTETQTKTCYRQVIVGYQQQCDTRYETVCHNERQCHIVNNVRQCYDRRVCQSVPRYYCYQRPVYRTESYPCNQTVQIPYTVKDYDVQASVKVVYGSLPAGAKANEAFQVSMNGDVLSLRTVNAKSNILIFVEKDQHENLAGNLKTIETVYKLSFMNATDVTLPLSKEPGNFLFSNEENLTWDTKLMANPALFSVNLVIKKAKALASDVTVADQLLPATAFAMTNSGNTTRFATTLTEAGVSTLDRDNGKYKVFVTLRANLDTSKLLNPASLPDDLEVTGDGKFKLK